MVVDSDALDEENTSDTVGGLTGAEVADLPDEYRLQRFEIPPNCRVFGGTETPVVSRCEGLTVAHHRQ